MLDVLCLGEALWDLHAPEGVSFAQAKTVSMRAGGAAVNVAMGLARRGARAGVAAVVGDEALGEALIARLTAAGVDAAGIVRALPRTGVLFAERALGSSRFVGYRSADEPAPALPENWSARTVLLTGLMPSPDHARAWCRAAREARDDGARLVVDVNARPRVFRDRDPTAALAVLAEADVVKASEGDLEVLAQRAEDLRDRMRAESVLVITAGPGPARALGKFGEVVRATEGKAGGDPLGAGDAFTVGVLLATIGAESLDDPALWDRALRRGHALARAHLRRR